MVEKKGPQLTKGKSGIDYDWDDEPPIAKKPIIGAPNQGLEFQPVRQRLPVHRMTCGARITGPTEQEIEEKLKNHTCHRGDDCGIEQTYWS